LTTEVAECLKKGEWLPHKHLNISNLPQFSSSWSLLYGICDVQSGTGTFVVFRVALAHLWRTVALAHLWRSEWHWHICGVQSGTGTFVVYRVALAHLWCSEWHWHISYPNTSVSPANCSSASAGCTTFISHPYVLYIGPTLETRK
jgi:hypothetical protein